MVKFMFTWAQLFWFLFHRARFRSNLANFPLSSFHSFSLIKRQNDLTCVRSSWARVAIQLIIRPKWVGCKLPLRLIRRTARPICVDCGKALRDIYLIIQTTCVGSVLFHFNRPFYVNLQFIPHDSFALRKTDPILQKSDPMRPKSSLIGPAWTRIMSKGARVNTRLSIIGLHRTRNSLILNHFLPLNKGY